MPRVDACNASITSCQYELKGGAARTYTPCLKLQYVTCSRSPVPKEKEVCGMAMREDGPFGARVCRAKRSAKGEGGRAVRADSESIEGEAMSKLLLNRLQIVLY